MKNSENTLSRVIALEWEAFQGVNNAGGRAGCQDQPKTFAEMRRCQFYSWSDEALESYLRDLLDARECGRNLLMEKYARMMAWTAPDEYLRIRSALPDVPRESKELINEIAPILLAWQVEFARKYPRLAARSRPVHSIGNVWMTSFETYMRGELQTYSLQTLKLYAEHVKKTKDAGGNLSAAAVERLARLRGYRSLEHAEQQA